MYSCTDSILLFFFASWNKYFWVLYLSVFIFSVWKITETLNLFVIVMLINQEQGIYSCIYKLLTNDY